MLFDPERLSAGGQTAFWHMLGHLQHHGPTRAADLAAVMTGVADVSDKFARTIMAWASRDGYLTRMPDGNSFRYDLSDEMR